MGKKREPKKLTNYLGQEIRLCSEFKRPRTRREMLAAGIIPFATSVVAPSIMQMISTVAHAQKTGETQCGPASAEETLAPVITIVLAGGPAMASNWVPKDERGELLANYSSVGLGRRSDIASQMTSAFVNQVDFYSESQILNGIQQRAIQTTREQTAFFATAVETNDDTRNNKIGIEGVIEAVGRKGDKFGVLGYQSSSTGHYHDFAGRRPSVPTLVAGLNDLINAMSPTGTLARLSQGDKIKLMKMVDKLSEEQKKKLASISGGKSLMDLVGCATDKNIDLLSMGTEDLNPLRDGGIAGGYGALWGINNANINNRNEASMGRRRGTSNTLNAVAVYNVLKGNAITCSLQVGGCDYHGSPSRQATDTKDLEAGQLIGRVLQSAALMDKKLFLHVTTDGAVDGNGLPGSDFNGDNGTKSAFYTMLFDPNISNKDQLGQTEKQMGHYNASCSVDTGTLIGGNPELASLAVVYNYLAFSYGDVAKANAEFDKVAPNTFSRDQKDQIRMYMTST